ncbi:uncharacterized protein KGF55_005334 [Candida pseudojiufengensis]|uniref:uncharacterized protein n=1 Tax=Candida pseudojiufengensis TaxID=497109 RepID=UPI0022256E58|nr:uncharacterized protein KGF55_005334 [Candida pseudojiufengensis]KAI5959506.1 hypothetical protein KGF55_005334 [Candida pseudojiufengensis]
MAETNSIPDASSTDRLLDEDVSPNDDTQGSKNSNNSNTEEEDPLMEDPTNSGTIQSTALLPTDQRTLIQSIRSNESMIEEAAHVRRCLPCWNYGSDTTPTQPAPTEELDEESRPRSSYTIPGSASQQQPNTFGPIINNFLLEMLERWLIKYIRRHYNSPYFIVAVSVLIIITTITVLILALTGNLNGLVHFSKFFLCALLRQFQPSTEFGFCSRDNTDEPEKP